MATQSIDISQIVSNLNIHSAIYAAVILIVGITTAKIAGRTIDKLVAKKGTKHQATLVRRFVFYTILLLFLFAALQQIGFKLGVLLGAAGILTVAIGFASQQSMSNLVSGLFLIAERPFKIGDSITVGSICGEVVNIGLLSAKLRTVDNTQVRIPNQQLISSNITTVTYYPIRRIDITVGVAYKEDLEKVRDLWKAIATQHELALSDPEPQFAVLDFAASAINLRLSVWTKKNDYTVLKTDIQMLIKRTFDNNGIEMPFPHTVLSTAKGGEPLHVRIKS